MKKSTFFVRFDLFILVYVYIIDVFIYLVACGINHPKILIMFYFKAAPVHH